GILVETTTGDVQKYSILLSPIAVLDGAVQWLFGAEPPFDSVLAKSGLDGGFLVLVALAYTAATLGLLYRRFTRMGV
ncbi:MAG TPA: hypothetical protein VJB57_08795, partial [Dehalococcoidia bacterium]|nr:hypothetical protein [Dehalococcoidia bacterium]